MGLTLLTQKRPASCKRPGLSSGSDFGFLTYPAKFIPLSEFQFPYLPSGVILFLSILIHMDFAQRMEGESLVIL